MKTKSILVLLVLAVGLFSCNKDKRGLSWNSNYSVPIAITTITLNNFISDTLLESSEGKTGIIYKANLFELDKSSLFNIPDTTISYLNGLPFGSLTVYPNQTIIENNQDIQLPTGQAGLSRMIMESGKLNYTLSNRILQPIILTYTIPGAIKNNSALTINIAVPAAESVANPAVVSGFIDLTGYNIDLTGSLHNSINKISSTTKIKLSSTASATQVDPSNTVSIALNFNQLKPYYAKGYFGQSIVQVGPSYSNLDVFKNFKSGSFALSKVSCSIDIENGIGVDARLKIKSLSSSKLGNNIQLSHQAINKNLNINRAIDNPFQKSNYVINATEANSNIGNLIELMPDKLGYEMQVEINPLGNISNGTDFIYTDRLMKAKMDLRIPLNTRLDQLVLQDTIRVNLNDEDSVIINNGKLKLYVKNYFNNRIKINLFTINDDNTIGENIATDEFVSPLLNGSNEKKLIAIDLNSEVIARLFKMKRLLIKVSLDSDGKYVEIIDNSRVEIQAVADFEKTLRLK